MKKFLSAYGQRLAVSLMAATLMMSLTLMANGDWPFIGAILVGYLAAAACLAALGLRLWQAAEHSAAKARRQMLFGLALRLLVMLLVFGVAIHISLRVFGMVVLGFLLFYLLAVLNLIVMNYGRQKK